MPTNTTQEKTFIGKFIFIKVHFLAKKRKEKKEKGKQIKNTSQTIKDFIHQKDTRIQHSLKDKNLNLTFKNRYLKIIVGYFNKLFLKLLNKQTRN